jgi:hypothetical protein
MRDIAMSFPFSDKESTTIQDFRRIELGLDRRS